MSKQTAVDFLKHKLMYLNFHPIIVADILDWIEQAKQMEKEQIKNAFKDGIQESDNREYARMHNRDYVNAEQYYNQTFKSEQ